jgi:hypothetical protein
MTEGLSSPYQRALKQRGHINTMLFLCVRTHIHTVLKVDKQKKIKVLITLYYYVCVCVCV